jgi:hypothetical protein
LLHIGLISASSDENNCNIEDFTDPSIIFFPEKKLYVWRDTKNAIIGDKHTSGIDLILGETASSGTGGCPDLSNSFAAGFWWVHTLGEVAALRYDQVYRQDFVGWSGIGDVSHYAMAGDPGWSGAYITDNQGNQIVPKQLVANPDFYSAVLWKQLMGQRVLNVSYNDKRSNPMSSGLSLHSHCYVENNGDIVLAYANPTILDIDIGYHINTTTHPITVYPRTEYFLTTGSSAGDLQSRFVKLNNGPDVLSSNSSLSGKYVHTQNTLCFPSMSYGYVRLHNAALSICS